MLRRPAPMSERTKGKSGGIYFKVTDEERGLIEQRIGGNFQTTNIEYGGCRTQTSPVYFQNSRFLPSLSNKWQTLPEKVNRTSAPWAKVSLWFPWRSMVGTMMTTSRPMALVCR